MQTRKTTSKSAYLECGVSCSKDNYVDNKTLVFHPGISRDKFCGESPAFRVASERYLLFMTEHLFILLSLCLLISCKTENIKVPISVTSTQKFEFKNTDSIMPYDHDIPMFRRHFSDSTFLDYPLLCSCDTCTSCGLLFKKKNGNWFIKADEEWQEFFSSKDSLIKVVYFKKQKFILKPLANHHIFNDKYLFGFIQERLYVNTSHIPDMWFHPDYGVIIIGQGNQFIREDIISGI